MGKPIATLNFSIHAPGLGKNFSQAGCQLSTTYGAARPSPMVKNIRTMTAADCAKAKPSAAPRKGAVQGVAKIVASTPLKNAPDAPCWEARSPAAPITRPLKVTSNKPNRFSATTVTLVGANNTDTDFGFYDSPHPNPGTGTPGYWKNHPEAWPVAGITIGANTYTKAQAISWLGKVGKDKTTTIFASYVSAFLNVKLGNDDSCVASAMASAYTWLSNHPVGSNVAGSSAAWREAEPWHQTMDAYNNGLLCVQHRD